MHSNAFIALIVAVSNGQLQSGDVLMFDVHHVVAAAVGHRPDKCKTQSDAQPRTTDLIPSDHSVLADSK